MTTESMTTGKRAGLTKLIIEAMKDCKKAMEISREEFEEEKAKAHEAYNFEKNSSGRRPNEDSREIFQ